MQDDLDVTPAGSSTPKVRLYRDSVDAIDQSQEHAVEEHLTVSGGDPGADNKGIGPVDLRLQGDWVGADASTLADRLETILDDQSVERVDIAGVNNSTRYDGTYYLAANPGGTEPAPQTDAVFSYELRLFEEP